MTQSAADTTVIDLFAALDRLDLPALGELLADDVSMVDEISRKWLRGKDAVLASLAPTFAAVQSIRSTLSDLCSSAIDGCTTVTCVLDQTYVIDGAATTITAPTTCVLRRADNAWKIVVMHSVPLAEG